MRSMWGDVHIRPFTVTFVHDGAVMSIYWCFLAASGMGDGECGGWVGVSGVCLCIYSGNDVGVCSCVCRCDGKGSYWGGTGYRCGEQCSDYWVVITSC